MYAIFNSTVGVSDLLVYYCDSYLIKLLTVNSLPFCSTEIWSNSNCGHVMHVALAAAAYQALQLSVTTWQDGEDLEA